MLDSGGTKRRDTSLGEDGDYGSFLWCVFIFAPLPSCIMMGHFWKIDLPAVGRPPRRGGRYYVEVAVGQCRTRSYHTTIKLTTSLASSSRVRDIEWHGNCQPVQDAGTSVVWPTHGAWLQVVAFVIRHFLRHRTTKKEEGDNVKKIWKGKGTRKNSVRKGILGLKIYHLKTYQNLTTLSC